MMCLIEGEIRKYNIENLGPNKLVVMTVPTQTNSLPTPKLAEADNQVWLDNCSFRVNMSSVRRI